jgi:hypothetical protein
MKWMCSSSILHFGTRFRWVVSLTPLSYYPPEKSPPGTHWVGEWVGPGTGLDAVEKRKILHYRESNQSLLARTRSHVNIYACKWSLTGMDCGCYLSPFSSHWSREYLHACTRNAKFPPATATPLVGLFSYRCHSATDTVVLSEMYREVMYDSFSFVLNQRRMRTGKVLYYLLRILHSANDNWIHYCECYIPRMIMGYIIANTTFREG